MTFLSLSTTLFLSFNNTVQKRSQKMKKITVLCVSADLHPKITETLSLLSSIPRRRRMNFFFFFLQFLHHLHNLASTLDPSRYTPTLTQHLNFSIIHSINYLMVKILKLFSQKFLLKNKIFLYRRRTRSQSKSFSVNFQCDMKNSFKHFPI